MRLKKILLLSVLLFWELAITAFAQSSTGYAKIPFETKDDFIVLPVNFSRSAVFKLIFTSASDSSSLTQQGIDKLSHVIRQDIYDWLRKDIAKKEPSRTEEELEERIKQTREGKISLTSVRRMNCGSFVINNESFFDAHSSTLPADGWISINAFKNARNIVIDCKNNIFEINAPIHGKNGIPMYRMLSGGGTCYVFAELDGRMQPFVLSTLYPLVTLCKDTEKIHIYDDNEIYSAIDEARSGKEIVMAENTRHTAKIKVGDIAQDFVVYDYNDKAINYGSKESFAMSSLYNILGLPFFQGKCVQLDFENMMLYVR